MSWQNHNYGDGPGRWAPSGAAPPMGQRGGANYGYLDPHRERQPHLFGAHALTYRQGGSVVNSETPPTWAPERFAGSDRMDGKSYGGNDDKMYLMGKIY